jgi:hypothetical protein
MNNELRRAVFEDLAVIRDQSRSMARSALTSDSLVWTECPDVYERMRSLITSPDDVDVFATAVQEFVNVALHSVLVMIDGGTASAEVGRISLVDETGESLGEGLHEVFVEHLFDTGRLQ